MLTRELHRVTRLSLFPRARQMQGAPTVAALEVRTRPPCGLLALHAAQPGRPGERPRPSPAGRPHWALVTRDGHAMGVALPGRAAAPPQRRTQTMTWISPGAGQRPGHTGGGSGLGVLECRCTPAGRGTL